MQRVGAGGAVETVAGADFRRGRHEDVVAAAAGDGPRARGQGEACRLIQDNGDIGVLGIEDRLAPGRDLQRLAAARALNKHAGVGGGGLHGRAAILEGH